MSLEDRESCQTSIANNGSCSSAHRRHARKPGEAMPPDTPVEAAAVEPNGDWMKARRKSWARSVKNVFETDPSLCACGA